MNFYRTLMYNNSKIVLQIKLFCSFLISLPIDKFLPFESQLIQLLSNSIFESAVQVYIASNADERSSMMSSICSTPMERRTVEGVICCASSSS